jgi:peptidoglycan/xylan/chitin deacetylase (PgdA/CDA1 family)
MTLAQKIRRHVSAELAKRFLKTPSRQAASGRQVSFCFDDFPQSAADAGAEILQAANARGTYYFAAGMANSNSPVGPIAGFDTIRRLAQGGHEIGCHTFDHQDCTRLSGAELEASLAANRQAVDGCRLESFAFPFGFSDWRAKAIAGQHYSSVRTGMRGINRGQVDLAGLKSVPLYQPAGIAEADRWLKLLAAGEGWLIFYTHDVSDRPSRFGCTPELLAHCIARAAQLGCRIETVGAVAKRLN